jgi:hypothetical protein
VERAKRFYAEKVGFFGSLGTTVELGKVRVVETPDVTHMTIRVSQCRRGI